jgi:hypothetical protein
MTSWKMPPASKVYEALSAVADGRVHVSGPRQAEVESSGRDRAYTVEWTDDRRSVMANDNASYWQGYLGYPIVAVLITLGVLRVDESVTAALAGVPWHELNTRFKRDYAAAVEHVLDDLEGQGVDRRPIVAAVDAVLAPLTALELERPARRRRPPRS